MSVLFASAILCCLNKPFFIYNFSSEMKGYNIKLNEYDAKEAGYELEASDIKL